jgi:hypothetical protein
VDWIDVAEDRDKWWVVVKAVNEQSGSTQCGEILEWLRNYKLLKQICAALRYFLFPENCGHIQGPARNLITKR